MSSGWGPKNSRSTGPGVTAANQIRSWPGRRERGQDLTDEVVECALLDPADDDDQVVLPVDVDDVAAIALEGHHRRRRVWKWLAVRVEEPVHEAVGLIRWPWRPRHLDPLGRYDLPILPFAVPQEQVSEPCHIARRDEHATAPMAPAGHRLYAAAVELDPGILVAVPSPRARRANWFHHFFPQHLGERSSNHVQCTEREKVYADVVVFVASA